MRVERQDRAVRPAGYVDRDAAWVAHGAWDGGGDMVLGWGATAEEAETRGRAEVDRALARRYLRSEPDTLEIAPIAGRAADPH